MRAADPIDSPRAPALAAIRVNRIADSASVVEPDILAVEEPLEIRLGQFATFPETVIPYYPNFSFV